MGIERLKNKHNVLDDFGDKMSNLSEEFWTRAKDLIPDEWMVEDIFLDIRNHISVIKRNKHEFVCNLKIILT